MSGKSGLESRFRSRAGAADAFIVFLIATFFAAGTALLLQDPTPMIMQRRGTLSSISEEPAQIADSHVVQVVRLQSTSGLDVSLTIKRHFADSAGRYPIGLLLGGHHTGQNAVRLIESTRGTVAAAVSYPYAGDPRPYRSRIIRELPHIRRAFFDTPAALLLSLDYLITRAEVDSAQVEAIGVSLGVPFIVIAGALDQRISRVWALHGSGGSFIPLEHNMRSTIPFAPLRYLVAGIANLVLSGPRMAPERWVARISPRPFVMINAADDERLPLRGIESLFRVAREPKELIWVPGAHVRPDTDVVRPLVELVMARIRSERLPASAPAERDTSGVSRR